VLDSNACQHNYQSGLHYAGESGGRALQNLCEWNFFGIRVAQTASPVLEGNTCRDNEGSDIYYADESSDSSAVLEPFCEQNYRFGVYVSPSEVSGEIRSSLDPRARFGFSAEIKRILRDAGHEL
jgi:hypothetical protein